MSGDNTARPLKPSAEKLPEAGSSPSLHVVRENEKPITWDDLLKTYPGLALQGSALLAVASSLAFPKQR